ncbi:MAG: EAL domain-containing protein [Solirubrobacterales bacterium]
MNDLPIVTETSGKRLPLGRLKVDREFVACLGQSEEDTAIVAAILSMAHALGVEVIAEGVETDEQLTWLREHRCDLAQGFLLARPLRPEQLGIRPEIKVDLSP